MYYLLRSRPCSRPQFSYSIVHLPSPTTPTCPSSLNDYSLSDTPPASCLLFHVRTRKHQASHTSFNIKPIHPPLDYTKPVPQQAPDFNIPSFALRDPKELIKAWASVLNWEPKSHALGLNSSKYERLLKKFHTVLPPSFFPNPSNTSLATTSNVTSSSSSSSKVSLNLSSCFTQWHIQWLNYIKPYLPKDVLKSFDDLYQKADLRSPGDLFPDARQMKREIIMHVGPTNSGKTYQALKLLESAENGAYCGPLRLLAKEVYQKLNARGTSCNLITGEERVEKEGAKFTSYTVEMVSFQKTYDVVVIDEIQMIGDAQRGWAWLHALLGIKAKTLVLCGEASCVPLIQSICSMFHESVQVNEYERLGPLKLDHRSLNGDFKAVKRRDAVIVFARESVFQIQKHIQRHTGLKCAVVYGSLPPECRAEQAKLFNQANSGYDILISTDAIGMGLNLSIQRIVIMSMEKFNGQKVLPLTISALKQIAGRAGRYGHSDTGLVTTFNNDDFPILESMFKLEVPQVYRAGIQPTVDMVESFSALLKEQSLYEVIKRFEAMVHIDYKRFFMCRLEDIKKNALAIENIDLPIRDRYLITLAPVKTTCSMEKEFYINIVSHFAVKNPVFLLDLLWNLELPFQSILSTRTLSSSSSSVTNVFKIKEDNDDHLAWLEKCYRLTTLYLWLHQRFLEHPTFASTFDECSFILNQITQSINRILLVRSQVPSQSFQSRLFHRPHVNVKSHDWLAQLGKDLFRDLPNISNRKL